MKKILCIIGLSVLFSLTIFADGGIATGGKTCTTNCIANPDTQVEITKVSATSKSLTETANDYFGEIVKYFTEITF
jgi:predicted solute-binding protein